MNIENKRRFIETAVQKLIRYVESEQFRGYDPFDALNSPIINLLTKNSKWLKIAAIQAFRRIPINIRPLFLIPKDYNPKGMGLFLSSYVKLYRIYGDERYLKQIEFIADWLTKNYSVGYSGYCWGYNFDWQNKSFFAPKGTPTIVNTSFIGHAFLDAFETLKDQRYLEIARSACNFIMYDLNIHEQNGSLCFSYTPNDNSIVYNANYLGASLLARVYSHTSESTLLEYSIKAYKYCNLAQNNNGSWVYGSAIFQNWIDSFHTGFNLFALQIYEESLGTNEFEAYIQKGLKFYIDNFFLKDGKPKYYHNSIFPIDIHCSAQALVTLSRLSKYDKRSVDVMEKVLQWTIENMQHPKGYFYFRKGRLIKNKIPYIRWSQAWMLFGLSEVLLKIEDLY